MKNETKHVMSVTISTGRPGPSDTPKKPRRKKRVSKKSEVSEPEFGTPSSAKPSHGKPTDNTVKTDNTDNTVKPVKTVKTVKSGTPNGNDKTDAQRQWIEDVIWSAPHKDQGLGNISTTYSPTVRGAMYRREKSRARIAYRGQMLIAYRTGLILGTVLGVIIGLGAWWLTSLFA
jgi:hypothetical protein